jgi:hypothetical protein
MKAAKPLCGSSHKERSPKKQFLHSLMRYRKRSTLEEDLEGRLSSIIDKAPSSQVSLILESRPSRSSSRVDLYGISSGNGGIASSGSVPCVKNRTKVSQPSLPRWMSIELTHWSANLYGKKPAFEGETIQAGTESCSSPARSYLSDSVDLGLLSHLQSD